MGDRTIAADRADAADRSDPGAAVGRAAGPPDRVYPDRLFLKALVIMIVRGLPTVHGLLVALDQPTPEMQALRRPLTSGGRFPTRRTWERRLAALPSTLPARIGCLGRHLVELLDPWAAGGRAVAIDSTVLHARGGVWHKKHRDAGVVPHTSIDTEAHWTKSGWHGWVYGWKLHLVTTVAAVWIPLAAELTPANTADNEPAPRLLDELPADGPLRPRRHPLQRPRRPRPLRGRRPLPGRHPPRRLPAHRRRRRGPPRLPQAALARHRELQRPVQGHLRRPRLGPDARPRPHPALRPRRRLRLPTHPALPLRARPGPPRRPQSLPQSRLSGRRDL